VRTVILIATLVTCACNRTPPPKLTDAVPASATAIAGANLTVLRNSPAFARLPATISGLREASKVLLVWDGRDLLILAEGVPPGYTTIAPGISAAGSPSAITAAKEKLGNSRSPVPGLIQHAGTGTVWAAVHGDGRLPLTGNLANVFNLLRQAEYTMLSGDLQESLKFTITAECPSPEHARRFEGSFRAIVTVAAASVRRPEIADQLRSIRVAREDRIVRATGMIPPEILSIPN
jgi:hypothetical protein